MKRWCLMMGLMALTIGTCGVSGQAALVADWQFNDAVSGTTPDVAADSSGSGLALTGPNDGTALTQGMYWTSGQGGGTNGAVHFTDGGHGSATNAGYLTTGTYWDIGYSGTIVAKVKWNGAGAGNNYIYSSKLMATGRQNLYIASDGSVHYQDEYWSYPIASVATAVGAVTPGQWTKIQVSWDGPTTTAKIYINDHLVADSSSFSPACNYEIVDQIAVGAQAWSVAYLPSCSNTFNGDIDSVQYYNSCEVPEPMTLTMLMAGGWAMLRRRK